MQAERTINDLKIADFDEDVFIPFVSDEEDDGFSSLQQTWRGDNIFEQLMNVNEDEE